jgi:hypothetical protein
LQFVLPLGVAASLFVACGGGVGSGGTGSFASGPITGFGSVIVNGVRFDDAQAQVDDDDGQGRTRADLRLGMWVDIESSFITGTTATAQRIRLGSALVGPLTAVDIGSASFHLLGQRVTVDATTVFDESLDGGLDGLQAGHLVAVYGAYDAAAARYRATRVEPAPAAALWRLRAPLAEVDTGARTLRIGGTSYSYVGASDVPADLAAGQFVRLRVALQLQPLRWVVQDFDPVVVTPPEGDGVKLKGLVSAFTSASDFSVNGFAVDAAGASYPDGSAGIALGVRVEVQGRVRGGRLQATEVSIESDDEERDRGFELTGAVLSVNPAQQVFVLRGVTISTARPDLRYEDGSAADLTVGRRVEVRGQLSVNRQRIEATRIKFE